MKKHFKVHYFLAYEGYAELMIFAYLKNRFRSDFETSNIKFRELTDSVIFSSGKINGVKNLKDFEDKYTKIKGNYPSERFLFFIDNDLYHSSIIHNKIIIGGDLVQKMQYNSEFLLMSLYGCNLKDISEFGSDFQKFRDYCKNEFLILFGKDLKYIVNDNFLNKILKNVSDETIKQNFDVLFSLCEYKTNHKK